MFRTFLMALPGTYLGMNENESSLSSSVAQLCPPKINTGFPTLCNMCFPETLEVNQFFPQFNMSSSEHPVSAQHCAEATKGTHTYTHTHNQL